jgi:Type I restriction-modification system methyltransferase subunit
MKLTQQQLEAHLWGAANILRGKTAGQDYKNYILSLMFYKRLCDQWECEADDAIAEQERLQGRPFTEKQKEVFRKRGAHRFNIPEGAHWDDVLKLQQILVMFSQARCVRSPTRMP